MINIIPPITTTVVRARIRTISDILVKKLRICKVTSEGWFALPRKTNGKKIRLKEKMTQDGSIFRSTNLLNYRIAS